MTTYALTPHDAALLSDRELDDVIAITSAPGHERPTTLDAAQRERAHRAAALSYRVEATDRDITGYLATEMAPFPSTRLSAWITLDRDKADNYADWRTTRFMLRAVRDRFAHLAIVHA